MLAPNPDVGAGLAPSSDLGGGLAGGLFADRFAGNTGTTMPGNNWQQMAAGAPSGNLGLGDDLGGLGSLGLTGIGKGVIGDGLVGGGQRGGAGHNGGGNPSGNMGNFGGSGSSNGANGQRVLVAN